MACPDANTFSRNSSQGSVRDDASQGVNENDLSPEPDDGSGVDELEKLEADMAMSKKAVKDIPVSPITGQTARVHGRSM